MYYTQTKADSSLYFFPAYKALGESIINTQRAQMFLAYCLSFV